MDSLHFAQQGTLNNVVSQVVEQIRETEREMLEDLKKNILRYKKQYMYLLIQDKTEVTIEEDTYTGTLRRKYQLTNEPIQLEGYTLIDLGEMLLDRI